MTNTLRSMPLLSTLAALVIIAHSAEDNLEPEYRDFRPRLLDSAPVNYDQVWPEADIQQMQPSERNNADVFHDSDESLRRRRPGRKRKRRPLQSTNEDFIPPETYANREGSIPLPEEEFSHNTEVPKRRRKKINREQENVNRPKYWNDDNIEGTHGTLRRKGQKRKRPINTSPEISEIDKHPNHEDVNDDNGDINLPFYNNNYETIDTEGQEATIEGKHINHKNIESMEITTDHEKQHNRVQNEKSNEEEILNISKEYRDNTLSEIPAQNKRIDPLILKELLKKSKGISLSEILQQNNLSLSDLLSGKKEAVSILKPEDSEQSQEPDNGRHKQSQTLQHSSFVDTGKIKDDNKSNNVLNPKSVLEARKNVKSTEFSEKSDDFIEEKEFTNKPKNIDSLKNNDYSNKFTISRRFPVIRRKLRMRPLLNNSFKAQLSRDLLTLSSMKYHNRNSSKFREFKDVITPKQVRTETEPSTIIQMTDSDNDETTTYFPDEAVTAFDDQMNDLTTITLFKETNVVNENYDTETSDSDSTIPISSQTECDNKETTTLMFELEPEFYSTTTTTTTESPKEIYPNKAYSSVRRQAFDNRLKRKRMKQRISTEAPDENVMKDEFNAANEFPASEFITKTKTRTPKADDEIEFTTLEDFLTTEPTVEVRKRNKSRKRNFYRKFISSTTPYRDIITTEVTAKIEIQEILNDSSTSQRLSKILKERNMTLHELVEQRERGSSHIHLADIFHNTSREPNPPEPFLSKSLIEPISKETYPLRALLEANQHDPKTTTFDSITEQINPLNKPIVMDFGNNVNENSENMGIISLFQNFTKQRKSKEESKLVNGVRENPVEEIKTTTTRAMDKETRGGRILQPDKALITWNEIINLMQNKEQNGNNDVTTPVEYGNPDTLNKFKINEDPLDERLGIFDDLQYLTKHLESEVVHKSKDNRNINLFDDNVNSEVVDTLEYSLSTTKSVTVATASIIGLSLLLFLLTYTILKWKQESKIFRNNSRKVSHVIPTPVFEHRKGLKMNSSTRSKSPMLSSSNIYTIDSLDTHKGNDSPEYMWDSLRKPYQ